MTRLIYIKSKVLFENIALIGFLPCKTKITFIIQFINRTRVKLVLSDHIKQDIFLAFQTGMKVVQKAHA